MAELLRSFNWAGTPLGPVDAWDDTLLVSVNMILAAHAPMQLFWGPDMLCLYNDAMAPALADKHPASMARPARDVWAEAWHIMGPQLESIQQTGEAMNFRQALVPLLQNGELRQTYWDYSYSPVFAPDGSIAGILDVAYDSTDVVLTRREREVTNERLQQILAATTDGVALLDREWNFAYLNDAGKRALMVVSDDMIGRNAWETFPGMIYPDSPFEYHYRRAMDLGLPGDFETTYPDPLNVTLHLFVRPVAEGILIIFRDITAQKKTHQALIQTEKLAAVGRLAASIAHEINNPLESVTNLLYLSRTSNAMDEVQQYLDLAERELRRVSVISNQTLRFYKQSTDARAVTCEDLFSSVLSIYQGRLVNSHIRVDKRKLATHPVVCFDGEIRQVLNNLVGNAIDAMHPGGGRLILRSHDARHPKTGVAGITMVVADTGSGMPLAVRKHILEPFTPPKASAAPAWACGSAKTSWSATAAASTSEAAWTNTTTAQSSPSSCRWNRKHDEPATTFDIGDSEKHSFQLCPSRNAPAGGSRGLQAPEQAQRLKGFSPGRTEALGAHEKRTSCAAPSRKARPGGSRGL